MGALRLPRRPWLRIVRANGPPIYKREGLVRTMTLQRRSGRAERALKSNDHEGRAMSTCPWSEGTDVSLTGPIRRTMV